MTNKHIINNEMINSKKTGVISFFDADRKIQIILDKEKRFIQNFSLLDVTIVEILIEYDHIDKSYFLHPYLDNPYNLKDENIYSVSFSRAYS